MRARRSIHRTLPLWLTALVTPIMACSSLFPPTTAPGTQVESLLVSVENSSRSDVTVYLVSDAGSRTRLGPVTSLQKLEFHVPTEILDGGSTYHLLGDPVGSPGEFLSRPLAVDTDMRIDWSLGPSSGTNRLDLRQRRHGR